MKNFSKTLPPLIVAGAMVISITSLSSCRTSGTASDTSANGASSVVPPASMTGPEGFGTYLNSPGPAALPNARIYKTSIDVDAYVPVQVNPVDGKLVSYPAPGDITGASMPVVLKDGWLLDRRGISPDTRFVRYTYSQYHDLSEAPSPEQLLESIIPDAYVTEIVELPYRVGDVNATRADSIIMDGLKRCETVYKR